MKILSPFFVFSAFAILFSSLLSIQGSSPSSALAEPSSTNPDDWTLSYISTDTTTIPANSYSEVRHCIGLSTNNGNDGICATVEKTLVKVTFAPFTFGTATTSAMGCTKSFALESQNLVGCARSTDIFFFDLSTLADHSTTASITQDITSLQVEICGTFLIAYNNQNLYKVDLTNLASGAVTTDTSSDGVSGYFTALAANSQGTRFVAAKSGAPRTLLLYDLPTTAADPIGAHIDTQTFTTGTSMSVYFIVVPGADDKNFKVYSFLPARVDVFSINSAGIESHKTVKTELALYTPGFLPSFKVPNTNLLVVGAQTPTSYLGALFVFDTSRDKVTQTAVAVDENPLSSMVPIKESDDTIKFHVFTESGTVKALAKIDKTQPSDAREPTLDPVNNYDWTLAHSSSNSITGFTGVERCAKVSKYQNRSDVICSSTEKKFIRATLSPFTVTDESISSAACPMLFNYEPVPQLGCFAGATLTTFNPLKYTNILTKSIAMSADYFSVSQTNRWFLSTDGDSKIVKVDFYDGTVSELDITTGNSLKPKQIVHNADGTKAVVSVISSATATDTSIALLNIPIGKNDAPSFITSQAVTGLTSPFEHLFYRPGADADNFKVYGFAEGKMAVIDITGGNTVAITVHSTSTAHGDFPLAESGVFLPTPETATHLVLGGPKSSSDSDAALFVIDLSTNDYYKAPVSGCNSGSSFKSMVPMIKSESEIDFHVFTSAGTEECVFNFKGVSTPAPTPAPTAAPPTSVPTSSPGTPAPPAPPTSSPSGGGNNNQQNNNNNEATSSPRTKAVIASTSAIGGLGLVTVIAMIVYSAYFKNKNESSAPDTEMSNKKEGDNANTGHNAV